MLRQFSPKFKGKEAKNVLPLAARGKVGARGFRLN